MSFHASVSACAANFISSRVVDTPTDNLTDPRARSDDAPIALPLLENSHLSEEFELIKFLKFAGQLNENNFLFNRYLTYQLLSQLTAIANMKLATYFKHN